MRKLVGITALFAGLALLFSAGAMPAYAEDDPNGANGTVKIHDWPEHKNSSDMANDPKVCQFEIHGFKFDRGQTGRWWIQDHKWGNGDESKAVLSGSYGPADANGDWTSGPYRLADGHYKLFVEMTHTAGNSGKTVTTYKHKVFKVECGASAGGGSTPTPTPTPTPVVGGFESNPTTTPVTTVETEVSGNVTIRTETTTFIERGEQVVIVQVFHNDVLASTNETRTAVAGSESAPGQSILAGLGSLPATSTGAAGLGLAGLAITGLGFALLRRQSK